MDCKMKNNILTTENLIYLTNFIFINTVRVLMGMGVFLFIFWVSSLGVDILSAIKVSRQQQVCSAPLLGSSLATNFEEELVNNYQTVYVWLDRDKAKNAIKIKNRLKSLGLESKAIITNLDPKEYNNKEIEQWLKNR